MYRMSKRNAVDCSKVIPASLEIKRIKTKVMQTHINALDVLQSFCMLQKLNLESKVK